MKKTAEERNSWDILEETRVQTAKTKTHDFICDIIVEKLIVKIRGLVDVKAGVDLDPEVVPIGVVEEAFSLVQFDGLTFATF